MHSLVFSTHNKHKLKEIRDILQDKYNVISLSDIDFHHPIPEDYDTLEANALQKARFVYSRIKQDCFADDTGLEVDTLGGAPGVYSARYCNLPAFESEDMRSHYNIQKLLKELGENPNRKANFRTVIALILNGKEYLFEGKIDGLITTIPIGQNGFGYDPVFVPNGETITMAQMDSEHKNKISHRKKAISKLVDFLTKNN